MVRQDKINRKFLQIRVDYLGRILHKEFQIDYYAPGGNPYIYRLQELCTRNGTTCWHDCTNYRMTNKEFYAYIQGMIDCWELYGKEFIS